MDLFQCAHKVPSSQLTVHIITHHQKIRNHLEVYDHLEGWVPGHLYWIQHVGREFLSEQGLKVDKYANNIINPQVPIDELGLLVIACMYHTHFGVILNDRVWYTTDDNCAKYSKFHLLYQGGVYFSDTCTGNWNMPSSPAVVYVLDVNEQENAVNLKVSREIAETPNSTSKQNKESESPPTNQPEKIDYDNSVAKTDLKEQEKVDSEKDKHEEMDSEQDQQMDYDNSVAKTDLKEQETVDSEKDKHEEMDSEQDLQMDYDNSVAKTDLKEQEKVDSEKDKHEEMDSEQDQQMDYDNSVAKTDSNIEQKMDSVSHSKHSKDQKMECKQSSKTERKSRSRKRPKTSTRCLRSSPSVANKRSKSSRSTATSRKAGKIALTLDDIFTAKPCTRSRTRTPVWQPKPNTSAKEKHRKKRKPKSKTVTDNIDKKQDAEEKVDAEDTKDKETDPEHKEKTEDAKDKKENDIEVLKKAEDVIADSVSETNSDHDMKEEVKPEERKAKPDNLLEPDPILKAFEKVHTVEEAVALLDVSDEEKPQKSIAVETNIETEVGVMNVKVIGLKPQHKKERKFTCPQEGCEEFKPTQGELNVHLQKVHHATFPCSKCDKKYNTANGLNKHFKKHFKFTNICSVCQKGFQFAKQLSIHE